MSEAVNTFYKKFADNPELEVSIMEDASLDLNPEQLKILQSRIQKKKDKVTAKMAEPKPEGSVTILTPETSIKEKAKDEETSVPVAQISDSEMEKFWLQIESLDPSTLISEEVLEAFKYVGYNPEIVLKTFLLRGQAKKRDKQGVLKDLMDVCTIAIIKGSITEKNLKKTSDDGKATYRALQDRYDLKNGGAKGQGSEFLTVARVAAAVPAVIMKVLVKKPDLAKKFVGPFGSSALPSYLRHQSSAACIPPSIPGRLRNFLIGLITAYTADQSKALSKSKSKPEELYDDQINYVETTYNSEHPKEAQRAIIFSQFSLSSDYLKLKEVADKIKKIKTDFEVITQAQLDEDLAH